MKILPVFLAALTLSLTASAEEIPWQEISRKTEQVNYSGTLWCNFETFPTIFWSGEQLSSSKTDLCRNPLARPIQFTGIGEVIELMRIIPGRYCGGLEDCFQMPNIKETFKQVVLDAGNGLVFKGSSDVKQEVMN